MKKLIAMLMAAFMLFALAACGESSTESSVAESSVAESDSAESGAAESSAVESEASGETTWTAVLYADFSCGDDNAELIKEYPFEYTGEKLTAEILAGELSTLTGLDFIISATDAEDGIVIDWAKNSTLIAGLDDRAQKDDFRFFDNYSLQWFMMDSLWLTLKDNLDAENVYYTMNDGQQLSLEDNAPVKDFPSDVPYMGSIFYFAHSDDIGGEDDESSGDYVDPYAITKGTWLLDGRTDTAKIVMDGEGSFTAYVASGAVEAKGSITAVDEFGDGSFIYELYNGENDELFITIYFDSETQFHSGNGEGAVIYLLAP